VQEDQAFVYPTDQVVGIVPDAAHVDEVVAALREAGASEDDVDVIRGGPGEGDLRPDVGEGGPIKAIVRTAQKVLGDEDERLHVLDDALEAGHHVVTVRLTGEDDDERDAAKAALGAAMRDHGAHDVAFYGKYQIQQLDAGAT
jgi:hypothetical protein